VGVIAEPEITEYEVHEDDFCVILASDGVWEFFESQQIAEIVYDVAEGAKKSMDPLHMAEAIVEQSSYMWKVEEGDYRDDITVVINLFPWQTPAMLAQHAAAGGSS